MTRSAPARNRLGRVIAALAAVAEARAVGDVASREEALAFLRCWFAARGR